MSIKIKGYEYQDTVKSSNGLIAEIYKSEIYFMYWIRFLKEIDGILDLITVRIRNIAKGGLIEIKKLIQHELFPEVDNIFKIKSAVDLSQI